MTHSYRTFVRSEVSTKPGEVHYFHLSQERIRGTHSPLDLPKPPGID